MGTGKLAMRIMPAYFWNGRWSLAKGYRRFSARLILVASVGIALIVIASEFLADNRFANYAIGVVILFLPAMAWVGAGAEFVVANQAAVRAAFVTRLLVPGSTLGLAVAYADIVAVGTTIINQTGQSLPVVLIWMAFFLTGSLVISAIVNYYNRKMMLVER